MQTQEEIVNKLIIITFRLEIRKFEIIQDMKFCIKLSQRSQRFIGFWGTKQPSSFGIDLDKLYRQAHVAMLHTMRWH